MKRLVTGEPELVVFRGRLLNDAMRRTRVTEEEVRAALRDAGHAGYLDVEAVVLENDGSFSVVGRGETDGRSALEGGAGGTIGLIRPRAPTPHDPTAPNGVR